MARACALPDFGASMVVVEDAPLSARITLYYSNVCATPTILKGEELACLTALMISIIPTVNASPTVNKQANIITMVFANAMMTTKE